MVPLPTAEYVIGDRVRVVPSEHHSTLHSGIIRAVIRHFKDVQFNYYLEVKGKKVSTRYLSADLERIQ